MRWRVNGLDASSGNSVLLDVEANNAVEAVAQAHDQDIVVSHVAKAGGERWRRAVPILTAVAVITLGLAVAVLENQRQKVGRALGEAEVSAQRMQGELQAARSDLAGAQGRVRFLEGTLAQREPQRDGEIRDLQARLSQAESAKAMVDQAKKDAAGKLAHLAAQVEEARGELAAAQERWKGDRKTLEAAIAGASELHSKLAGELAAERAKAQQDSARSAALERRIAELAVQVKAAEARAAKLMTQPEDSRSGEAPIRYALAIPYDDALAFAAMEFGKPNVQAGHDQVTVSASQAERANTFIMHTDKDRVFDATLQVCLAPDAPKDVLAANQVLVENFATSFTPRWKDHSAWLAKALKQAAPGSGRAENERLMLLTDHYRISLWCNRDGQYSIKVQPAAGE